MQKQSPKEILRGISFVYWAMLLGLVTFIVATSLFISHTETAPVTDPESVYIIKTVLIILLLGLVPLSYIFPQKQIAKIDKTLPLEQKLIFYRVAAFIRFALMNAAGILTALGFLLTGATNLIYLQAIILLFFIIYKPGPFKIASDLELDENEKQQIMPH